MLITNKFPQKDNEYGGIRTHSRYVVNLFKLIRTQGLVFSLGTVNYPKLANTERIVKKLDIVGYTLDSIKSEYKYSKTDEDFLPLSLSWLWIKGYYAIFHLMSLLISLEKKDNKYIFDKKYNSHNSISSLINGLLINKKPFNIDDLNIVLSGADLEKIKIDNHENLKNVPSYDQKLYKCMIRKVFRDENEKLKGIKGEKRKKEKQDLLSRQYSVFNVVLNYRERFNYSGFHYLNSEIFENQEEIKKFYLASYEVIVTLVSSIVVYLQKYSYPELEPNLRKIKNIL